MSTTTTIPDWARFAPSLAHLLPQLLEHEAVLAGYSSGPQPEAAAYDPEEPENLSVLIDNPWGEEQWITIDASGCHWFDCGEPYRSSFDQLLAYLAQLPRPLHTFGTVAWDD